MNKSIKEVRVIGGQFKGRKLFVDDPNVKPTPDRVRETLFNWLDPVISGSNVLDLFAGTGVLAIEALSRGALSATFVDHSQVINKNLEKLMLILELDNYSNLCLDAYQLVSKTNGPMKQHGFIVKQTGPLIFMKILSTIFLKNLEQVKYTML